MSKIQEKGYREFWKIINEEKDKIGNSVVFSKLRETKKRAEGKNGLQWAGFVIFFREIAPSL